VAAELATLQLAVIYHGYARTTEDIDLLVEAGSQESLDARLAPCGFARETPHRLRHRATGVPVHLLIAGEPMPRPGGPPYPSSGSLPSSPAGSALRFWGRARASSAPAETLRAYVQLYLREEIQGEALVRNLPAAGELWP
jgi:hypothetical protein